MMFPALVLGNNPGSLMFNSKNQVFPPRSENLLQAQEMLLAQIRTQ
jgi:serine/threonine protein kinase